MTAINRYRRVNILAGGKKLGTSRVCHAIRRGVQLGQITITNYTLKENERLDTIAGRYYGDASLWWVIAAASGIGWGLQVPAGTQLTIPVKIGQVEALVG